ncbi:MAG: Fic family protein [Janthinobacterium lividum]
MQISFTPNYRITSSIANNLMRIEAAKEKILHLPLTPKILISLRETAKLYTTHYSTMIEGNALNIRQITEVLKYDDHFPGRERDEHEVKGYYRALEKLEQIVAIGSPITETTIKTLHALVMSEGDRAVKPTPYRKGQNVIKDAATRAIVYMPPEAKDVPQLMKQMVAWINDASEIPSPIVAAIAHYQFATIHPYFDGNGRTARLFTTLILHQRGYDLKGLYSLEEYYARNLGAYYQAISVGDSHNYYMGRAEANITEWVEYFICGMKESFENVLKRMSNAHQEITESRSEVIDQSHILRKLDPKQRKSLELFEKFEIITSKQIGELFGFKPRTSAKLCAEWVENGFLIVSDRSNKGRKYSLAKQFKDLLN